MFGGRAIGRCGSCGLQQILPVPAAADLDRYYRGVYRSQGRSGKVDLERHPFDSAWYLSRGRALSRFLRRTAWSPPADRAIAILDIGAGYGHVLFALSERWRAARLFATEPDPGCAPFLERIGATILPQSAEGLPLEEAEPRFDLIVMTHVLEHLPAPVRTLTAVAKLLTPGGRVIVEVPNCPSAFAGQWETAPHLSFFEVDTLAACVARAGGTVERLVVCGPRYDRGRLRDRVVAALERAVRKARRRRAGDGTAHWRDPDVVPEPVFTSTGPDRWWLRATLRF